jgi:hypothetical protein
VVVAAGEEQEGATPLILMIPHPAAARGRLCQRASFNVLTSDILTRERRRVKILSAQERVRLVLQLALRLRPPLLYRANRESHIRATTPTNRRHVAATVVWEASSNRANSVVCRKDQHHGQPLRVNLHGQPLVPLSQGLSQARHSHRLGQVRHLRPHPVLARFHHQRRTTLQTHHYPPGNHRQRLKIRLNHTASRTTVVNIEAPVAM